MRQILNVAAGSAEPAYDGQGRFWNRSLPEFEATTIYGIAMIAPPGTPDRGAASGLVRGLRGEWPFDGTQFPPLPWGGTRVAPPDIQLISDWIDDGLPEVNAQSLRRRRWRFGSRRRRSTNPNAYREQLGAIKARHDVEHLSDTELANLRGAIAELMALNAWPRDLRSYNAWAQLHGDECPHGWSIFLPWHRMYLWGFEHQLQDISPSVTLPYWDWTQSTPQQIADGYIPEAFRCWVTDAMLSSLSGKIAAETIKLLQALEGQTFTSIKRFWAAVAEVPESEQPAIVDALKVVNPLFSEQRWPGDFSSGRVGTAFNDHVRPGYSSWRFSPSTGSDAPLKRRHLLSVKDRSPLRRPVGSRRWCQHAATMGRCKALRPRPAFRALTRLTWEEAIAAKRQHVVAAACTRRPRSQSRR